MCAILADAPGSLATGTRGVDAGPAPGGYSRRVVSQVSPDEVATRMRFDPLGLLNPGKLRGWDLREQVMADLAAGSVALATLLRF